MINDDAIIDLAAERSPAERLLRSVELRVGKPPRPLSTAGLALARAKRPAWLTDDDALVRLFLSQDQIVRTGLTR